MTIMFPSPMQINRLSRSTVQLQTHMTLPKVTSIQMNKRDFILSFRTSFKLFIKGGKGLNHSFWVIFLRGEGEGEKGEKGGRGGTLKNCREAVSKPTHQLSNQLMETRISSEDTNFA